MAGTGRQSFNESENVCLQELVLKYELNSATTTRSIAAKKAAWALLTEEFNAIETNSKRTEAQLKKCWENMKTRRKSVRTQEKREGMRTEDGSANPKFQVLEVSLAEETDFKLIEVIYSDDETVPSAEMTEVLDDSEVLTDKTQVSFAANESRTQVLNESAIETDYTTTPPHLSEFRLTEYGVAPPQAPAATPAQIEALINFMSENKELARGQLRNTEGRVRSKQLWEGLSISLNSMGSCIKSVEQWQRVWADKKHLTKKAAGAARRSASIGGVIAAPLSQMELRILSIMGEGFGEPQTDARAPSVPAGPPVREPAAVSPPHTSAATPASPVPQEQPSVSPEALDLELPTRNQQRSRNLRNGVTQEESCIPQILNDRSQKREEELHRLKIAEKHWVLKAAEHNYYKAKAEREAAEELLHCNRAKRKEAELRLAILRTKN